MKNQNKIEQILLDNICKYLRTEHNLTEIEQRLFEKQWMSED